MGVRGLNCHPPLAISPKNTKPAKQIKTCDWKPGFMVNSFSRHFLYPKANKAIIATYRSSSHQNSESNLEPNWVFVRKMSRSLVIVLLKVYGK